jgi:hypothetical protein
MSSDMLTVSKDYGKSIMTTLNDTMAEAWKGKANKCPCKGGLPPKFVCMMTYQDCEMDSCPFVLWGCL